MLELEPLCEVATTVTKPMILPRTPFGTRMIVECTSSRWEGERLKASQRGAAAADWLTVGPDGTGTLDVRETLETDDGALIYVTYEGRTDMSGGRDASPRPIFIAPRFETGDERYAWLNRVQAIGKGVFDGTTVRYSVYEAR